MIFVLEEFIRNRREKREAWLTRGHKWVSEKNEAIRYSMYSFDDYERNFPDPNRPEKILGLTLVISLVAFMVGWGIFILVSQPVDSNNPNNCTLLVKKDDNVAVTFGSFVGSKGVVISQDKKCAIEMKLTESTNTRDECIKKGSKDCREERNTGETLTIGSSQHIIKL